MNLKRMKAHMIINIAKFDIASPIFPCDEARLNDEQRLKDMRQLSKDPHAAAKAQAAKQKADAEAGLKTINLLDASSAAPKKKPVFKSILQTGPTDSKDKTTADVLDDDKDPSGAMRNGWHEQRYRPQFVTGCNDPRCRACQNGQLDLGPITKDVDMRNS